METEHEDWVCRECGKKKKSSELTPSGLCMDCYDEAYLLRLETLMEREER